jgi:hypothetical protein
MGDGHGKVVVATGWWSPDARSPWSVGDDLIRSSAFFPLWHRQVMRCLDPAAILVTDSASPNKPDFSAFSRVQVASLDRNYGHANDLRVNSLPTRYSGFTRSVLMGAMFALCCEADFYVYVEQDCLLRGEDFLSAAISDPSFDFYCGAWPENARTFHGGEAARMPQRSLQIARRVGIVRLIETILSAPEGDGELSGEAKMERDMAPLGHLAVPYGRSRPIDFSLSHFYAQQMTLDELLGFLAAEGLAFDTWFGQLAGQVGARSPRSR